ncbi:hypothetical protein LMH87_010962 [Akanthomyces muscarius]|uniref:Uncharacterized protein n=1 Tax=Akanthomyces muscarius TaxID=2231603 RepID=A0A9W8UJI1_AKAMU|nr:hypothetical protein LMH87_010962 [Akanthomyces muscarius]KAJ4150202.1 hypothetical protein LMH87_010962 [Akanthomyces muscarius]
MSLIPTGAQLNGPVAATSALYGLYRLASSTVNLLIRLASGQWENAATSPRRWRVLRPPHDVSFKNNTVSVFSEPSPWSLIYTDFSKLFLFKTCQNSTSIMMLIGDFVLVGFPSLALPQSFS